eukprot:g10918.t1.1.5e17418a g10918  g10918.t1 contig45:50028-51118(+)
MQPILLLTSLFSISINMTASRSVGRIVVEIIAILSLAENSVTATAPPTKKPTSRPSVYVGTSKWYVSVQDNKCKKDCAESSGADCGGITRDEYTISNGLYANTKACCANGLSYLDKKYCMDRSKVNPNGTGMYYAVMSGGYCLKDEIPANAARGEGEASATDKLFTNPTDCCSTMTWIPSAYCLSRTRADRSAAPVGYSGKWFVDYTDSICKADCATAAPFIERPSDASTTGASCKPAPLQTYRYYDTAVACCDAHLGWIPSGTCEAFSTTGVSATSTGTNKWYADYSDVHCVKDCSYVSTDASTATCGGVLRSNLAAVTLYDAGECVVM